MALARDLIGAEAMLAPIDRRGFGPESAGGLLHPGWYHGYLFSQALTIGGGTGDVQRNIVGERVLGLPHDADVTIGMSWSETQRADRVAMV
jgi:hypothetical protein